MSDDVVQRFAEFVGPETFNKFLHLIADRKREGKKRLAFWQEQKWNEFRAATGVSVNTSFAAVSQLFRGVKPKTIELTQAQFVREASRYWKSELFPMAPDDWVAAAWRENAAFREDQTEALCRVVSKVGSLDPCRETTDLLRRILAPDQMAAIADHLRDHSQRLEDEWRPSFERAFTTPKRR